MALIREHRIALLAINLGYFGLFGLGILSTALVTELQPGGLGALEAEGGNSGVGAAIAESYRSENVLLALVVTFLVNLILASVLQTTIPSFIIPFLGVAITLFRGYTWGVLFSPIGTDDASFLIHWVTLLIEGEAYVFVGLASWVQSRYWVQAKRFGFANWRRGWLGGLVVTAKLYVPVILLLLIGAIYEAITVILFIAA